MDHIDGRHPPHGVIYFQNKPHHCIRHRMHEDRERWLATTANHEILRDVWIKVDAWYVGRYIVMPDHLHLFAAPNEHREPFIELENWIRYFKSQFTKRHATSAHRWQSHHWDTRLRNDECYDSKWEYVRNNAVRAGLVDQPDQWPLQGEIVELRWE